jgi:hypothetical protein
MNIILIGNCQIQPIGDGLRLAPEIKNIYPIPVHLMNSVHYVNAINTIKKSNDEKYVILQFDNLISKVDLGSDILSRVDKKLSFTQLYFGGLHPDITYFGQLGKRILSPLGDYHSKICLLSFMKGYSEEECIKLYNYKIYERLNFFSIWESSEDELCLRDQKVDIKFASDFFQMVKNEPTLFTINHPIGIVFDKLVKKITESIGINYPNFPSAFCYNYLANNSWWPVYPEIIDYHKISYSSQMYFKSPDNMSRKFYDLDHFINASYKAYNDQKVDVTQLPSALKSSFESI